MNTTVIKHIVVIMQENRSTDNLFNGFPGADTVKTATQKGKTITLQPVPLEQGADALHTHIDWVADYDNGAPPEFTISEDDVLILMGKRANLQRLENILIAFTNS
jgi:hypothetical protein